MAYYLIDKNSSNIPEYKIEYKGYIYCYDTAIELANMVKETGTQMENPYEPHHVEYDIYNRYVFGW